MKRCKQMVRKQRTLAKTAKRIAFASVLMGLVSTASAQSPFPSEHNDAASGLAPIVSATSVPQPAAEKDRTALGSHAVALAAAQATAEDLDDAGSLIDIDIPIPGVPSTKAPAPRTVIVDVNSNHNTSANGVVGQSGGMQSSRRGVQRDRSINRYVIADDQDAPEVLPRDTTMRIKIEPVPVPVNDTAQHLENYSSDSVISAAQLPTFDEQESVGHHLDDAGYAADELQTAPPTNIAESTMPASPMSIGSEPSPHDLQYSEHIAHESYDSRTEIGNEAVPPMQVAQQAGRHSYVESRSAEIQSQAIETPEDHIAVRTSEVHSIRTESTQPVNESRPVPPSPSFLVAEEVSTQAAPHAASNPVPRAVPTVGTDMKSIAHATPLPSGPVAPAVPVQGSMVSGTPAHSQVSYEMDDAASEPATVVANGVQPVGEFEGNLMVAGESLRLRREDVSSFSTKSPIIEYSVEHPGICKMIRTSENTVSVIGLRDGITRVAVVTADPSGNQIIEIRDVQVAGGEATESGLQAVAQEMSQTISKLYPKSRVRVISGEEKLWVRGLVHSESDARKILSLVRKMTLTPVVDQLRSTNQ